MAEVALGKLNKAIAYDPGVSESTVKAAGVQCCDLTDAVVPNADGDDLQDLAFVVASRKAKAGRSIRL